METIKTADYSYVVRTAVWLPAKVRDHGLGQQPRLYAGVPALSVTTCVSRHMRQFWRYIHERYF